MAKLSSLLRFSLELSRRAANSNDKAMIGWIFLQSSFMAIDELIIHRALANAVMFLVLFFCQN